MKKLIFGLLIAWVGAILVYAGTPTATLSSGYPKRYDTGFAHPYVVYEYTVQPLKAAANSDSIIIGPFTVGGIGYEDSIITVQMTANETVADSVHYKIAHQMSSAASPNSGSSSKDWITYKTDTAAFDSTLKGASSFKPRLYSAERHYRALITASAQTGTSSTVVFRFTIPLK